MKSPLKRKESPSKIYSSPAGESNLYKWISILNRMIGFLNKNLTDIEITDTECTESGAEYESSGKF